MGEAINDVTIFENALLSFQDFRACDLDLPDAVISIL